MRIAIVDDDYRVIADMTRILKTYFLDTPYEQDDYSDGLEFVDSLKQSTVLYDIVFMDIEMRYMNGEDAVRKLREMDENEITYIVYISSHTDNLSSLFALHPFDFLVKPLEDTRVREVLARICQSLANDKKTITLLSQRKALTVYLSEIIYVQSEAHRVLVYLRNIPEPVCCYMKIADIYNKLDEVSSDFIRIHASFIVNKNYVTMFSTDSVLIGKERLPVSQKYKNEMMVSIHRGM